MGHSGLSSREKGIYLEKNVYILELTSMVCSSCEDEICSLPGKILRP